MSEVKRFKMEFQPEGAVRECVYAADFDRVTAERDALQQRLTAADELADALEEKNAALHENCQRHREEKYSLRGRSDLLEGLLRDSRDVMSGIWDTSYDHEAGDALAALDLMERIDAALKP